MTKELKNKFKFALIGTSCAGKTTAAYALVSRLKSYSVLADGVFSQDRKFSFDKAHLATEEIAQQWMVNNLIAKETDTILHEDIDVLITDRSALDLMSYYALQFPESRTMKAMLGYVTEYLQTYSALYYLPPLPFQDDGKRPGDAFRKSVDTQLVRMIAALPEHVKSKVKFLERNKVLEDVMMTVGVKKPNSKYQLDPDDMQFLANRTGLVLHRTARSFRKEPDVLSDNDIFVEATDVEKATLVTTARSNFGPWVTVDIVPIDKGFPITDEFLTFNPA